LLLSTLHAVQVAALLLTVTNPWTVPLKLLLPTWEEIALHNDIFLLAQNTFSSSQDVKFLNQLFIWRTHKMKGTFIFSGARHSIQGR